MKPTLGLILISLVLLGSVAANYYLMPPPNLNPVSMFNITGELEVYKNGVLVHKGPDILTNNFYAWLYNTLLGAWNFGASGNTQTCPTPSWATSAGVRVLRTDSNGYPECTYAYASGVGSQAVAKIHFGTGSSVPQRSDYALANELTSVAAVLQFNAPSGTGQRANLTFSGSYTASSATTINEVGLSFLLWVATGPTPTYALVARDQISQSLAAGDVLTVVYRLVAPINFETVGSMTPRNGGTPLLGLIAQCVARSTSVSGLPGSATFGNYCVSSGLDNANIVLISPDAQTSLNNQGKVVNSLTAPTITILGYAPSAITIGSIAYRVVVGGQVYNVLTFFLSTNRDLVGGQAAGLQFSGP